MINTREEVTPREQWEAVQHKEMWEMQANHEKEIKAMEIEVMKLEAKITAWFKLPVMVVMLPVKVVLALGYVVAMARKAEPGARFWDIVSK